MYAMKNPMHDRDREKASSIVLNMVVPEQEEIERSPYLNKVPETEPVINLHSSDLYTMS